VVLVEKGWQSNLAGGGLLWRKGRRVTPRFLQLKKKFWRGIEKRILRKKKKREERDKIAAWTPKTTQLPSLEMKKKVRGGGEGLAGARLAGWKKTEKILDGNGKNDKKNSKAVKKSSIKSRKEVDKEKRSIKGKPKFPGTGQ